MSESAPDPNYEGKLFFASGRYAFDSHRRPALISGLKPEFFGLTEADITKIESRHLEQVQPAALKKALLSTKDGWKIGGIWVNPREYEVVPRSQKSITKKFRAKTAVAQALDPNLERASGKIERAPGHVLEAMIGKTRTILDQLAKQREELKKLAERYRFPQLNRGYEPGLQILTRNCIEHSFVNILEVSREASGWDMSEDRQRVSAMLFSMTCPEETKVEYGQDLTDLALWYNNSRKGIFVGKVHWAEVEARKRLPQAES